MTKIDIISGFLGAGKTTLIKKLLKEALSGSKVVLIENEFGEIGIDGGFLKEAGIKIREMNSGCICCSLVGDFDASLKEVMKQYHPDRILIEPSGVGKLSDVMRAVENASAGVDMKLNSAVTVVDASKAKVYLKNFGEFFENQITYAGTILLTRADKVSQDKIQETVDLIRQYNQKAVIITTPITQLSGQEILDTFEGKSDLQSEILAQVMATEEEHHHHHHHDEHAQRHVDEEGNVIYRAGEHHHDDEDEDEHEHHHAHDGHGEEHDHVHEEDELGHGNSQTLYKRTAAEYLKAARQREAVRYSSAFEGNAADRQRKRQMAAF